MFEAALLLSHVKKLRTPGVAAALQSGGACTLFAEAAGGIGLSAARVRARHEAPPQEGAAALRLAEQPARRDRSGRGRDRHVRAARSRRSRTIPSVGLIAFDAFPPRIAGETPWADPVLRTAIELQRSTGVAFASVAMSPLAYSPEAVAFTRRWKQLPFLQGHRAASGRDRARWPGSSRRTRARSPTLAAAPEPREGRPGAAGSVGSARRGHRARSCSSCTGCAVRRSRRSRRPGWRPRSREASGSRWPSRRSRRSCRTRRSSAACGSGSRTRPTWRWPPPRCSRPRRRAGAAAPKVLVQEMAAGAEVLVGAVVDDRFGALITMRPGGALAEAGEAVFVPLPAHPEAGARLRHRAGRAVRARSEPTTTCGQRPARSKGWRAPRTTSATG